MLCTNILNDQIGDSQATVDPQLTVLHTAFVREQNRLVKALRNLNPSWTSETLYQEARLIIMMRFKIRLSRLASISLRGFVKRLCILLGFNWNYNTMHNFVYYFVENLLIYYYRLARAVFFIYNSRTNHFEPPSNFYCYVIIPQISIHRGWIHFSFKFLRWINELQIKNWSHRLSVYSYFKYWIRSPPFGTTRRNCNVWFVM